MLETTIKVTTPIKDSTNSNKPFIHVASQDIVFFKAKNVYPFIKLTNNLSSLSGQTITEVADKTLSLSPFDTLSNMTKFIEGKIFNNSSDTLSLTTHIGGTLIGIQEAKDQKGDWRPIEYWFNDRCGNSFNTIELAPNDFVNFYIPRYYGSFKTKVRLRFLVGSRTYISSEWEGRIDKKQFIKPKEAKDKELKIFYSFLE